MRNPAPSHALAPVGTDERIRSLDILRGVALFGMIVVHFHQRVDLPAEGVEDLIGWAVWIGIETKAWGTFAFLFGVGFAVLLRRIEAKGLPFVSIYLRRLFVLALLGIVAEAFFGFSVLLQYAVWGVPLLFLRRVPTRAVLTIAAIAVAIGPLLSAGATIGWWPPVMSEASRAHERVLASAIDSVSRHGSFLELAAARWAGMRFHYARLSTLIPDSTLTLFLLGLLAVRHRFVDEPRAHVRQIVGWMIFGFVSWAAWWLVLYPFSEVPAIALASKVLVGLGVVRDQWLCLTFMGAVTLLVACRPAWASRLMAFGWPGRMALTNYMLQVAVLDFLISGYGLSLRLRPALGMVAAALLFAVEAVLSRAWLVRYRFGPLEWAWRSLTYGRVQPMRRASAVGSVTRA